MTHPSGTTHVYLREIKDGESTSLSILAQRISAGSRVLDLGTGSGALGQFLHDEKCCVVDGVTYNEAEKVLALPHYRRIEVADLDECDLPALFGGELYDFVVCADVLEHLVDPGRVLDAAQQLLTPQGHLMISVPNAAYAGLIGELMAGEFRYREEGLLDRTHLRFFTRTSLRRFLQERGWQVDGVDAVRRELPSSEFDAAFDRLPPAVSRYLLAPPEALTYQLIVSAHPARPGEAADHSALQAPPAAAAAPLFTAQLYLGHEGRYDEERKLSATGVIGQLRQTVTFVLPATDAPLDRLRLDPADRPGFLHLYRITVRRGDGQVVWQWAFDKDGVETLQSAAHGQMVLSPASPLGHTAMVFLHGEDPWLELPIPFHCLASLGKHTKGRSQVEVEMGWPMSADYLALATPVAQQVRTLEEANHRYAAAAERALTQTHADYGTVLERERREHTQALSRERLEQKNETAQIQRHFEEVLGRERNEFQQALERERNEHSAAQKARDTELDATRRWHAQELARQQGRYAEERGLLQTEVAQASARGDALHGEKSALEAQHQRLVSEYAELASHLRWIENSTVFRATRPIVRAKMRLDRMRRGTPAADPPPLAQTPHIPRPVTPPPHLVDIIVPVYRGLVDTQCCIESVLKDASRAAYRLVVINDASPESEVTQWLREAATRDSRILLLENEENLGFVGTVNRGMALSDTHDVVLLNSDAEVANDWLDRIRRAAYSDQQVASVTPFSNNATICSYPRFCEDNRLPAGYDTAQLDDLFAGANGGQVVDVPTGVGFCMYVRRDALNAIGLFDTENFGKGYGEENDFCRRAAEKGWRNVHVLDTFVRHAGGVSFGEGKSPREQAAMVTLRRLHPDYEPIVHQFVKDDPARRARAAVDVLRLRKSTVPTVLLVMHDREGGTLRHVRELAHSLSSAAMFIMLSPVAGGVQLKLLGETEAFTQTYELPRESGALVMALKAYGVRHVHFHHLIGHGEWVRQLPAQLGVAYDFSVHDFYAMCPHISLTDNHHRYCGEQGDGSCTKCLNKPSVDAQAGHGSNWRALNAEFVKNARYVLAPSLDAARRMVRFSPTANIRLAPHPDAAAAGACDPVIKKLKQGATLKVLVIGALSAIKGADLLEAVAAEAVRRDLPIEFHLLGFAYRALHSAPDKALTVHGSYDDAALPRLLNELQADVAWFPAQWPETYSYTLSACLERGLPIVAPNIGAFPERLDNRPWTWIRPWDDDASTFAGFFAAIRHDHFLTSMGPDIPAPNLQHIDIDRLIGSWSYGDEYLTGLPPRSESVTDLNDDALVERSATGASVPRLGLPLLKAQLLTALVHMRAARPMSRVVRLIPQHVQTRVKTWLRA